MRNFPQVNPAPQSNPIRNPPQVNPVPQPNSVRNFPQRNPAPQSNPTRISQLNAAPIPSRNPVQFVAENPIETPTLWKYQKGKYPWDDMLLVLELLSKHGKNWVVIFDKIHSQHRMTEWDANDKKMMKNLFQHIQTILPDNKSHPCWKVTAPPN